MKPSEFLVEVFGPSPRGRIALWRLDTKRSTYLKTPGGADIIAEGQPDVYVSVALAARDHGARVRIKAHQAAGIGGLWLDIDVNGGPDGKTGAAPTEAAAIELACAIAEPTLIVNSGYGLHAWWLLHEPWYFASIAERAIAAHAAAQWHALYRAEALRHGWTIDPTHDLARLLRIPGTWNTKGDERVAVGIAYEYGPRYTREALLDLAGQAQGVPAPNVAAPTGRRRAGEAVELGHALPANVIDAALAADQEFAATWNHERNLPSGDHSVSAYDLALCSRAAHAGWTDAQLAGLIAAHRAKWGGTEKALRDTYVRLTIATARGGGQPDPAAKQNLLAGRKEAA